MAKKVCPKCNTENLDDAKFCDNCGENLVEIVENTQNYEKNEDNVSGTSQGRRWRIINSWWILLTFTLGFFNWVSFLYIGFTARQRKWVIWGVIYAIPFILTMAIVNSLNSGAWFGPIWALIFLGIWIVSIIHAFMVRKEYLMRLEISKDIRRELKIKKEEDMKKRIEEEYEKKSV